MEQGSCAQRRLRDRALEHFASGLMAKAVSQSQGSMVTLPSQRNVCRTASS
jgi:hypothetical protein